jgi:hypothetical protein
LSLKEKPVSDVESLSKKLDEVLQRLDLLEKVIVENPEYEGVAAALGIARFFAHVYQRRYLSILNWPMFLHNSTRL